MPNYNEINLDTRYACLLFHKPVALQELAEACYRFTPQIALRPPEALFLEIGGSRHLFREDLLILKLKALCRRFLCQPHIAVANTPNIALACARYTINKPQLLPLEALRDFASPFAIDVVLDDKISTMVGHLRKLGLTVMGDFQKLPPKSLVTHFGKEGLLLTQLLHHNKTLAWPQFRLSETIKECLEFPSSCESLEPVLFILKNLLDQIMARLWARGKRVSTLKITLTLERGFSAREWTINLITPQGSSLGLLPILKERLLFDTNQNPLETASTGIAVEILETAPSQAGGQRHFFNKTEETAENWGALMNRFMIKMGEDSAFMIEATNRFLPEKAWRPIKSTTLSVPQHLTKQTQDTPKLKIIEFPERPSRLLSCPQLLCRDGSFLVDTKTNTKWKDVSWQGPERISGEWWDDPERKGFQRDYYKVSTSCGKMLWVFMSAPLKEQNPTCFLHGYFD